MVENIEGILQDSELLELAFQDISKITDISEQMKIQSVDPDPYEGPHYSADEGNMVLGAYSNGTNVSGSIGRVTSFWNQKQEKVKAIYDANPEK